MFPLRYCGCCLLGLVWAGTLLGADRSAELVRMIPRNSNAVFILRVQQVLQTDRAVREQWADRQKEKFLAGESSVPPWVETLVVGSLVRPSVPESAWSAALAVVPPQSNVEAIAAHEQATVELLAGHKTVRGGRDAVYVDLQPGLLGVMSPAYRQEVARWIREALAGESQVDPFLQSAAELPGQIVLAMNLQDALDPQAVRARIVSDETLATSAALRNQLVTALLGLQGATMSITIGDQHAVEVVLQFGSPLPGKADVLQRVFVDVLGEMGVAIDEFESAEARIEGAQLRLTTNFSEETLRRVLSLIVPPAPGAGNVAATPARSPGTPAQAAPTPTPSVPMGNVTVIPAPSRTAASLTPQEASRRYLLSVNKMIDDLKAANRRAKNYEQTATWHDNFARKIDNLPTAGVDKELLAYGSSIASKFRGLAASLRGQAVQVQAEQNSLTIGYSYDPGWAAVNVWGGVGYRAPTYGVDMNLRQIRERQAAAVAAGSEQRLQIWSLIDNERAGIEQTLRQRYGDQFFDRPGPAR